MFSSKIKCKKLLQKRCIPPFLKENSLCMKWLFDGDTCCNNILSLYDTSLQKRKDYCIVVKILLTSINWASSIHLGHCYNQPVVINCWLLYLIRSQPFECSRWTKPCQQIYWATFSCHCHKEIQNQKLLPCFSKTTESTFV